MIMHQTILITGASNGLGLELAKIFARKGFNLVLVARNEEKLLLLKSELETKHNINAEVFVKDLSKKDAALEVFQFVEEKNIAIEILVNNAGFGDHGKFETSNWQKQSEMIHLNILALTQLTHLFLPLMVKRKSGKILNLASIASFMPGAMMSVYYATKAFVLSFSEALAEELKNSGVTVMALCPGPTKTGFEQKADLEESGLFAKFKIADAQEVAAFGYRKLMRKKVIAIPGFLNNLMINTAKFMPRKLVRNIIFRIQK